MQDLNAQTESAVKPMQLALRVIRWQGYVGLAVGCVFGLASGVVAAMSAGLGAGVAMFANYRFAKTLCARRRAGDAQQVAQGLYAGEAIKLVVTAALFGVIFKLFGEQKLVIEPQALFVGYVATLLAYWYALWRRI